MHLLLLLVLLALQLHSVFCKYDRLVLTIPSTEAAGSVWTTQPRVEIFTRDATKKVFLDTTVNGDIKVWCQANSVDGPVKISNMNRIIAPFSSGVAEFNGVFIEKAGDIIIECGLELGSRLRSEPQTVSISPGVPEKLSLIQPPGRATGGLPFAPQPIVALTDIGGNIQSVPDLYVEVSVIDLPADYVVDDFDERRSDLVDNSVESDIVDGKATFSGLFINKVGEYKLQFKLLSRTPTNLFDVTAVPTIEHTVRVSVGPTARLVLINHQEIAYGGEEFVHQPLIELRDAGGNRNFANNVSTISLLAVLTNDAHRATERYGPNNIHQPPRYFLQTEVYPGSSSVVADYTWYTYPMSIVTASVEPGSEYLTLSVPPNTIPSSLMELRNGMRIGIGPLASLPSTDDPVFLRKLARETYDLLSPTSPSVGEVGSDSSSSNSATISRKILKKASQTAIILSVNGPDVRVRLLSPWRGASMSEAALHVLDPLLVRPVIQGRAQFRGLAISKATFDSRLLFISSQWSAEYVSAACELNANTLYNEASARDAVREPIVDPLSTGFTHAFPATRFGPLNAPPDCGLAPSASTPHAPVILARAFAHSFYGTNADTLFSVSGGSPFGDGAGPSSTAFDPQLAYDAQSLAPFMGSRPVRELSLGLFRNFGFENHVTFGGAGREGSESKLSAAAANRTQVMPGDAQNYISRALAELWRLMPALRGRLALAGPRTTILPGRPHALRVLTPPAGALDAGLPMLRQPRVALVDAGGNIVANGAADSDVFLSAGIHLDGGQQSPSIEGIFVRARLVVTDPRNPSARPRGFHGATLSGATHAVVRAGIAVWSDLGVSGSAAAALSSLDAAFHPFSSGIPLQLLLNTSDEELAELESPLQAGVHALLGLHLAHFDARVDETLLEEPLARGTKTHSKRSLSHALLSDARASRLAIEFSAAVPGYGVLRTMAPITVAHSSGSFLSADAEDARRRAELLRLRDSADPQGAPNGAATASASFYTALAGEGPGEDFVPIDSAAAAGEAVALTDSLMVSGAPRASVLRPQVTLLALAFAFTGRRANTSTDALLSHSPQTLLDDVEGTDLATFAPQDGVGPDAEFATLPANYSDFCDSLPVPRALKDVYSSKDTTAVRAAQGISLSARTLPTVHQLHLRIRRNVDATRNRHLRLRLGMLTAQGRAGGLQALLPRLYNYFAVPQLEVDENGLTNLSSTSFALQGPQLAAWREASLEDVSPPLSVLDSAPLAELQAALRRLETASPVELSGVGSLADGHATSAEVDKAVQALRGDWASLTSLSLRSRFISPLASTPEYIAAVIEHDLLRPMQLTPVGAAKRSHANAPAALLGVGADTPNSENNMLYPDTADFPFFPKHDLLGDEITEFPQFGDYSGGIEVSSKARIFGTNLGGVSDFLQKEKNWEERIPRLGSFLVNVTISHVRTVLEDPNSGMQYTLPSAFHPRDRTYEGITGARNPTLEEARTLSKCTLSPFTTLGSVYENVIDEFVWTISYPGLDSTISPPLPFVDLTTDAAEADVILEQFVKRTTRACNATSLLRRSATAAAGDFSFSLALPQPARDTALLGDFYRHATGWGVPTLPNALGGGVAGRPPLKPSSLNLRYRTREMPYSVSAAALKDALRDDLGLGDVLVTRSDLAPLLLPHKGDPFLELGQKADNRTGGASLSEDELETIMGPYLQGLQTLRTEAGTRSLPALPILRAQIGLTFPDRSHPAQGGNNHVPLLVPLVSQKHAHLHHLMEPVSPHFDSFLLQNADRTLLSIDTFDYSTGLVNGTLRVNDPHYSGFTDTVFDAPWPVGAGAFVDRAEPICTRMHPFQILRLPLFPAGETDVQPAAAPAAPALAVSTHNLRLGQAPLGGSFRLSLHGRFSDPIPAALQGAQLARAVRTALLRAANSPPTPEAVHSAFSAFSSNAARANEGWFPLAESIEVDEISPESAAAAGAAKAGLPLGVVRALTVRIVPSVQALQLYEEFGSSLFAISTDRMDQTVLDLNMVSETRNGKVHVTSPSISTMDSEGEQLLQLPVDWIVNGSAVRYDARSCGFPVFQRDFQPLSSPGTGVQHYGVVDTLQNAILTGGSAALRPAVFILSHHFDSRSNVSNPYNLPSPLMSLFASELDPQGRSGVGPALIQRQAGRVDLFARPVCDEALLEAQLGRGVDSFSSTDPFSDDPTEVGPGSASRSHAEISSRCRRERDTASSASDLAVPDGFSFSQSLLSPETDSFSYFGSSVAVSSPAEDGTQLQALDGLLGSAVGASADAVGRELQEALEFLEQFAAGQQDPNYGAPESPWAARAPFAAAAAQAFVAVGAPRARNWGAPQALRLRCSGSAGFFTVSMHAGSRSTLFSAAQSTTTDAHVRLRPWASLADLKRALESLGGAVEASVTLLRAGLTAPARELAALGHFQPLPAHLLPHLSLEDAICGRPPFEHELLIEIRQPRSPVLPFISFSADELSVDVTQYARTFAEYEPGSNPPQLQARDPAARPPLFTPEAVLPEVSTVVEWEQVFSFAHTNAAGELEEHPAGKMTGLVFVYEPDVAPADLDDAQTSLSLRQPLQSEFRTHSILSKFYPLNLDVVPSKDAAATVRGLQDLPRVKSASFAVPRFDFSMYSSAKLTRAATRASTIGGWKDIRFAHVATLRPQPDHLEDAGLLELDYRELPNGTFVPIPGRFASREFELPYGPGHYLREFATNSSEIEAGMAFGHAVAVTSAADRGRVRLLAVGAPGKSVFGVPSVGAVYLYTQPVDRSAPWVFLQRLTPLGALPARLEREKRRNPAFEQLCEDPGYLDAVHTPLWREDKVEPPFSHPLKESACVRDWAHAQFGFSLSFSPDGSYLAVGAPGAGASAGAVFTFRRSHSGPLASTDRFSMNDVLRPLPLHAAPGLVSLARGPVTAWSAASARARAAPSLARFGHSVSFGRNTLAVGAPGAIDATSSTLARATAPVPAPHVHMPPTYPNNATADFSVSLGLGLPNGCGYVYDRPGVGGSLSDAGSLQLRHVACPGVPGAAIGAAAAAGGDSVLFGGGAAAGLALARAAVSHARATGALLDAHSAAGLVKAAWAAAGASEADQIAKQTAFLSLEPHSLIAQSLPVPLLHPSLTRYLNASLLEAISLPFLEPGRGASLSNVEISTGRMGLSSGGAFTTYSSALAPPGSSGGPAELSAASHDLLALRSRRRLRDLSRRTLPVPLASAEVAISSQLLWEGIDFHNMFLVNQGVEAYGSFVLHLGREFVPGRSGSVLMADGNALNSTGFWRAKSSRHLAHDASEEDVRRALEEDLGSGPVRVRRLAKPHMHDNSGIRGLHLLMKQLYPLSSSVADLPLRYVSDLLQFQPQDDMHGLPFADAAFSRSLFEWQIEFLDPVMAAAVSSSSATLEVSPFLGVRPRPLGGSGITVPSAVLAAAPTSEALQTRLDISPSTFLAAEAAEYTSLVNAMNGLLETDPDALWSHAATAAEEALDSLDDAFFSLALRRSLLSGLGFPDAVASGSNENSAERGPVGACVEDARGQCLAPLSSEKVSLIPPIKHFLELFNAPGALREFMRPALLESLARRSTMRFIRSVEAAHEACIERGLAVPPTFLVIPLNEAARKRYGVEPSRSHATAGALTSGKVVPLDLQAFLDSRCPYCAFRLCDGFTASSQSCVPLPSAHVTVTRVRAPVAAAEPTSGAFLYARDASHNSPYLGPRSLSLAQRSLSPSDPAFSLLPPRLRSAAEALAHLHGRGFGAPWHPVALLHPPDQSDSVRNARGNAVSVWQSDSYGSSLSLSPSGGAAAVGAPLRSRLRPVVVPVAMSRGAPLEPAVAGAAAMGEFSTGTLAGRPETTGASFWHDISSLESAQFLRTPNGYAPTDRSQYTEGFSHASASARRRSDLEDAPLASLAWLRARARAADRARASEPLLNALRAHRRLRPPQTDTEAAADSPADTDAKWEAFLADFESHMDSQTQVSDSAVLTPVVPPLGLENAFLALSRALFGASSAASYPLSEDTLSKYPMALLLLLGGDLRVWALRERPPALGGLFDARAETYLPGGPVGAAEPFCMPVSESQHSRVTAFAALDSGRLEPLAAPFVLPRPHGAADSARDRTFPDAKTSARATKSSRRTSKNSRTMGILRSTTAATNSIWDDIATAGENVWYQDDAVTAGNNLPGMSGGGNLGLLHASLQVSAPSHEKVISAKRSDLLRVVRLASDALTAVGGANAQFLQLLAAVKTQLELPQRLHFGVSHDGILPMKLYLQVAPGQHLGDAYAYPALTGQQVSLPGGGALRRRALASPAGSLSNINLDFSTLDAMLWGMDTTAVDSTSKSLSETAINDVSRVARILSHLGHRAPPQTCAPWSLFEDDCGYIGATPSHDYEFVEGLFPGYEDYYRQYYPRAPAFLHDAAGSVDIVPYTGVLAFSAAEAISVAVDQPSLGDSDFLGPLDPAPSSLELPLERRRRLVNVPLFVYRDGVVEDAEVAHARLFLPGAAPLLGSPLWLSMCLQDSAADSASVSLRDPVAQSSQAAASVATGSSIATLPADLWPNYGIRPMVPDTGSNPLSRLSPFVGLPGSGSPVPFPAAMAPGSPLYAALSSRTPGPESADASADIAVFQSFAVLGAPLLRSFADVPAAEQPLDAALGLQDRTAAHLLRAGRASIARRHDTAASRAADTSWDPLAVLPSPHHLLPQLFFTRTAGAPAATSSAETENFPLPGYKFGSAVAVTRIPGSGIIYVAVSDPSFSSAAEAGARGSGTPYVAVYKCLGRSAVPSNGCARAQDWILDALLFPDLAGARDARILPPRARHLHALGQREKFAPSMACGASEQLQLSVHTPSRHSFPGKTLENGASGAPLDPHGSVQLALGCPGLEAVFLFRSDGAAGLPSGLGSLGRYSSDPALAALPIGVAYTTNPTPNNGWSLRSVIISSEYVEVPVPGGGERLLKPYPAKFGASLALQGATLVVGAPQSPCRGSILENLKAYAGKTIIAPQEAHRFSNIFGVDVSGYDLSLAGVYNNSHLPLDGPVPDPYESHMDAAHSSPSERAGKITYFYPDTYPSAGILRGEVSLHYIPNSSALSSLSEPLLPVPPRPVDVDNLAASDACGAAFLYVRSRGITSQLLFSDFKRSRNLGALMQWPAADLAVGAESAMHSYGTLHGFARMLNSTYADHHSTYTFSAGGAPEDSGNEELEYEVSSSGAFEAREEVPGSREPASARADYFGATISRAVPAELRVFASEPSAEVGANFARKMRMRARAILNLFDEGDVESLSPTLPTPASPFSVSLWAEQRILAAPHGRAGDRFGSSVSLDRDTIAVGAPGRSRAAAAPTASQPLDPASAESAGGSTVIDWTFESGDLRGWRITGDAFALQPVFTAEGASLQSALRALRADPPHRSVFNESLEDHVQQPDQEGAEEAENVENSSRRDLRGLFSFVENKELRARLERHFSFDPRLARAALKAHARAQPFLTNPARLSAGFREQMRARRRDLEAAAVALSGAADLEAEDPVRTRFQRQRSRFGGEGLEDAAGMEDAPRAAGARAHSPAQERGRFYMAAFDESDGSNRNVEQTGGMFDSDGNFVTPHRNHNGSDFPGSFNDGFRTPDLEFSRGFVAHAARTGMQGHYYISTLEARPAVLSLSRAHAPLDGMQDAWDLPEFDDTAEDGELAQLWRLYHGFEADSDEEAAFQYDPYFLVPLAPGATALEKEAFVLRSEAASFGRRFGGLKSTRRARSARARARVPSMSEEFAEVLFSLHAAGEAGEVRALLRLLEPLEMSEYRSLQGPGPTGTLTSLPFTIEGDFMSFRVGGGCDPKTTYVSLLVGGVERERAWGSCSDQMRLVVWDLRGYRGARAHVRAVDRAASGQFGFISLDAFSFSWDASSSPLTAAPVGSVFTYRRVDPASIAPDELGEGADEVIGAATDMRSAAAVYGSEGASFWARRQRWGSPLMPQNAKQPSSFPHSFDRPADYVFSEDQEDPMGRDRPLGVKGDAANKERANAPWPSVEMQARLGGKVAAPSSGDRNGLERAEMCLPALRSLLKASPNEQDLRLRFQRPKGVPDSLLSDEIRYNPEYFFADPYEHFSTADQAGATDKGGAAYTSGSLSESIAGPNNFYSLLLSIVTRGLGETAAEFRARDSLARFVTHPITADFNDPEHPSSQTTGGLNDPSFSIFDASAVALLADRGLMRCVWRMETELFAPDLNTNDATLDSALRTEQFGAKVAVSEASGLLLVGAPGRTVAQMASVPQILARWRRDAATGVPPDLLLLDVGIDVREYQGSYGTGGPEGLSDTRRRAVLSKLGALLADDFASSGGLLELVQAECLRRVALRRPSRESVEFLRRLLLPDGVESFSYGTGVAGTDFEHAFAAAVQSRTENTRMRKSDSVALGRGLDGLGEDSPLALLALFDQTSANLLQNNQFSQNSHVESNLQVTSKGAIYLYRSTPPVRAGQGAPLVGRTWIDFPMKLTGLAGESASHTSSLGASNYVAGAVERLLGSALAIQDYSLFLGLRQTAEPISAASSAQGAAAAAARVESNAHVHVKVVDARFTHLSFHEHDPAAPRSADSTNEDDKHNINPNFRITGNGKDGSLGPKAPRNGAGGLLAVEDGFIELGGVATDARIYRASEAQKANSIAIPVFKHGGHPWTDQGFSLNGGVSGEFSFVGNATPIRITYSTRDITAISANAETERLCALLKPEDRSPCVCGHFGRRSGEISFETSDNRVDIVVPIINDGCKSQMSRIFAVDLYVAGSANPGTPDYTAFIVIEEDDLDAKECGC